MTMALENGGIEISVETIKKLLDVQTGDTSASGRSISYALAVEFTRKRQSQCRNVRSKSVNRLTRQKKYSKNKHKEVQM